jgi:CBS domain-containing protein
MKKVKEIMEKDVVLASPDMSLQDISKILVDNKLSGVPVVDDKKSLVGFVSERDIIASIGSGDFMGKRVGDIMTQEVVSAEEDATMESMAQIFTENPYRYLPIVKNKKIVGIVSRKDVIDRLLGQYY